MPLFILTETSAGYALLKAKDKKLLQHENLSEEIETAEQVCSLLKLKNFQKFDSAATALEEVAALVEGKVTPRLSSLLDTLKDEKKALLAVADPKLGNAINKLPQLQITPISDSTTSDLYRAIRNHLPSLIPGLLPTDISTMSLGLSHSLSRHKLKFSPDKVDTMIVQAIALLDDLDKELNTYAMRVKEWYGWHFPEMGKIVNDNLAYARVILGMGMRTNAANSDLSDILPEEIETAVKAAAEVSMGTEITSEDLDNIQALADQVVNFTEYRQQLSSYLSARMTAIAPNLTALVGDLVGARLIAHAGSLMNLAKSPASTIQILGAEKALFRALKTKHDTPKYGLIYHASLIGQATGKNKGKIARVLAAKAAIGIRVDALADWSAEGEGKGDTVTEEEKSALGLESRLKIERRLAALEGKPLRSRGVNIAPNGLSSQPGKWEVKEARKYNADADGLAGNEPAGASTLLLLDGKKVKDTTKAKIIQVVRDEDEDEDENMSDDDDDEDNSDDKDGLAAAANDAEAESDEEMEDEEDEADDRESPAAGSRAVLARVTNGRAKTTNGTALAAGTEATDKVAPSTLSLSKNEDLQSSILGNTKEAKKAWKIERHARKLAMAEEHKQAKELAKAHAAQNPHLQVPKPSDGPPIVQDEQTKRQDELFAKSVGLSLTRYRKKLERGQIKFNPDGTPSILSKKDIKRQGKGERKAEKAKQTAISDKKRKRQEEEAGTGPEKESKKRKAKAV